MTLNKMPLNSIKFSQKKITANEARESSGNISRASTYLRLRKKKRRENKIKNDFEIRGVCWLAE
jgi:hypothetical protein